MTDLQKKEMELLCCFDNLCKIMQVPYFLVCGSALGAAKYHGFIPWDDDIDVAMYRNDYEYFVQTASELLPNGYFLQNYVSDPKFPQIYSKLRNSATTLIEKTAAKVQIHHGVFLDVFPLDGYPQNFFMKAKLEAMKRLYSNMLLSAYDIPRKGFSALACIVWRMLKVPDNCQWVAKRLSKQLSKYDVECSEQICNHGNWQGELEYAPKWHYGEGTWATFEGLRVRIPENYDAYLTQKYGDWRADLPEDQKVGHHHYEICDLDRPYTDYIEKLSNGRIRVKQAP